MYCKILIRNGFRQRDARKTVASIFIERGSKRQSLTPYKHSIYRTMLYVDIRDIYKAFELFATKILLENIDKRYNSLSHVINLVYPVPITILELAEIIRDTINRLTDGRLCPCIKIIDQHYQHLFSPDDKNKFKVVIRKMMKFLGLTKLKSPGESIKDMIRTKLKHTIKRY